MRENPPETAVFQRNGRDRIRTPPPFPLKNRKLRWQAQRNAQRLNRICSRMPSPP
jgi:hypothetical protein